MLVLAHYKGGEAMNFRSPKFWTIIAVFCGVLWGVLRQFFMPLDTMDELMRNLMLFIEGFDGLQVGFSDIWTSFFRHGHMLALIWACSLLPKFFAVTYLLVYLRVMTLTFSISLMLKTFGASGILFALILSLPQNILVIASMIYTIHILQEKTRPKNTKSIIIGISAVIFAVLYEIFLAPIFFSFLN